MTTVASSICPMLTRKMNPPNCRNCDTVSTSDVTRLTSAPRRSVLWVSTGRSCTCRNALIRIVARPLSELIASRTVVRYDATAVTRMPPVQITHIHATYDMSGPPGPDSPLSIVC